jgi:hypothetical protein
VVESWFFKLSAFILWTIVCIGYGANGGSVPFIPTPQPIPDNRPHPQPKPIPVPTPTPAPVPKGIEGELHITLVYDPADYSLGLASIRASNTIGPALKKLDAVWRTFESSDPQLTQAHLMQPAQTAGYPCLIIQDKAGKIVKAVKAPTTEAEVLTLIKSLREGKP